MLRRFRQEKSVWLKYASFLLKQGQTEATHRLLERALKALPTKERKHSFHIHNSDYALMDLHHFCNIAEQYFQYCFAISL